MEELHSTGIEFIVQCQHAFKGHEEVMLFISRMADPRNAFLMFFPVAYFTNKLLGVQVLWAAVLSEWLNAVLKWMLHGERPYWWVHVTSVYGDAPPDLLQTRLTCETGPGSPSGHAMVPACALFIMLISQNHSTNKGQSVCGRFTDLMKYTAVMLFLVAAGVSRCFIATHFPHQVVAGTIAGCVLAKFINSLPLDKVTFAKYVLLSVILLLSAPGIYWIISALGYDPNWSVSLAMKWCAKSEWVYLDTTLFFALIRDSASLLGLGLALQYTDVTDWTDTSYSLTKRAICIVVSLVLTRGQEFIHLPKQTELFYFIAFVKYALLPFTVMVCVPYIVNIFNKTKILEKNS